ncbi:DHA2 family efflux MFS transporter permease subunit [Loigolactobacillus backii]|uniref:Multidrug MFS transporter n=1 Tax=Loigolactobacillus backii TaxID=375175 RepID=A0A192H0F6_9LACO|nr:DHA2 family efflux MFS transporter permease subunit [Loigolactobacillus backii]ANK61446.1 multidrug MFS transporter [Loigolactobacillus backii]ANK69355.1 multidrug MFS transporter [Loigolactobacillus backii]MDA5387787.1 DHA2 family efflux MFS transporter permease subunit [Loigolactobacillus backii]MDA5390883.1 DHA2 family efflux MFS transporter permease subunit [Loigolactobacillus backii]PIO84196.1 MFS transporter [Loigolactobacillus backii]
MKSLTETKRLTIMAGLLIGGFIGMFSETALNIALAPLTTKLGVSAGTIQWLVIGYLLMVGIVLPLSGLLSRWFTTRQLLIFALCDFIVGALVAALSPNFTFLLIGRLIQGIGTGILLPLIFLVALTIYPMEKRGAAMGLIGLTIMFAPAIGPTVAGLILGALSWQYIFWAMIPLLVIALIITIIFMKDVVPITRPHVDVLSIILSTLGFGGVVLGISLASDKGWTSALVLGSLVVGLLALFSFVRRQLKLPEPILNVRAFAHVEFSLGTILVMIDFMIIMSSMYLLPIYWQKGLLVPVALTGILMLPGGLMNAVVSTIAGRLYDGYGVRRPAMVGFLITVIGALMLFFSRADSSYLYVVSAHVILMIGIPLALSPAQTFGLNSLPQQMSADGSSIMNTLQQIFGAIATALATSLLGLGEAKSSVHGSINVTNGTHYGFALTVGLAVLGFLLTFALPRKQIN